MIRILSIDKQLSIKIEYTRSVQNVKQSEQLNGFEKWNSNGFVILFVIKLSIDSRNPLSSIIIIIHDISISGSIVVQFIVFVPYFLFNSSYIILQYSRICCIQNFSH